MITLEQIENEKRAWQLKITKGNRAPIDIKLNLQQFSLTNKYEVVKELFEELNELLPRFNGWYYDLLKEYIDSGYNSEIIKQNALKFKEFASQYVKKKNIDFSSFVDIKKSSKTSILFLEDDMKAIAIASTCLKLYSPFWYDSTLKVPDNVNKEIYNIFLDQCITQDTTDKIFQLIRARTFRSTLTDRYMWELIKLTVLETPETNVMSVFNFLMINLIALLDITVNPVHYLIRIADDSVKWMMKEVYKERIVYGESYGGTEDIFGASVTKESFHIYCCNDVISKCAAAALRILEEEYDLDYDQFMEVKDRLDSVTYLDPTMRLLILPIASKVLEIPYRYLITSPPKHVVLIGVLLYHLAEDTLIKNYPILSEFLMCYPQKTGFLVTKSSYKLRDIDTVMEDDTPIFGLNSRKLKFELISPICGILSASKKNLACILDGLPLSKITYNDLETDGTEFYTKLYSNKLDGSFTQMREKLDNYI
jgi:hypothetical protein